MLSCKSLGLQCNWISIKKDLNSSKRKSKKKKALVRVSVNRTRVKTAIGVNPSFVCFVDEIFVFFDPLGLDCFIPVEVKLAVHDVPDVRVNSRYVDLRILAGSPGSVT